MCLLQTLVYPLKDMYLKNTCISVEKHSLWSCMKSIFKLLSFLLKVFIQRFTLSLVQLNLATFKSH